MITVASLIDAGIAPTQARQLAQASPDIGLAIASRRKPALLRKGYFNRDSGGNALTHIAETYIRRDGLRDALQPLQEQLSRIESALTNKADKS